MLLNHELTFAYITYYVIDDLNVYCQIIIIALVSLFGATSACYRGVLQSGVKLDRKHIFE